MLGRSNCAQSQMGHVHHPSFSKGQGTVRKGDWNDFLSLLSQITVLISLTLIFLAINYADFVLTQHHVLSEIQM